MRALSDSILKQRSEGRGFGFEPGTTRAIAGKDQASQVESRECLEETARALRIATCFGSAQAAASDMEIQLLAGYSPEKWGAVLERMGRSGPNTKTAVRHEATLFL